MANTYTLIASNTLSSSAASVTFSSIPSTYTDLVLRISARTDDTTDVKTTMTVTLNNDTSSNYSSTSLRTNNGTTVSSGRDSNVTYLNQYFANAANSTSNTFSSLELYLPSYTSSANKPIGVFFTREGNTTAVDLYANANLWRNTASVNSVQIGTFGLNFVSGSSFFLYGIRSS